MKRVQRNNSIDRLQDLIVKDEEVEQEFQRDYGSRLRLVEGARIIQEIGNQLKCSIVTIAKAQYLFHRFRKLVCNSQIHYVVVAAACLNVSIKISPEDISFEQVLLKFYYVAEHLEGVPNPLRPDSFLEKFSVIVIKAEYLVCRVMNFKLECKVAHMYVFKVLGQIRNLPAIDDGKLVTISSSVTKLMSTYYLCEGCVDYDAYEIALSCFKYALLFCGMFVPGFKHLIEREIDSVGNKERISDILDELIVVAEVATTLNYI